LTRAVEQVVQRQLAGEEPLDIEQFIGRMMLGVRLAFKDTQAQMRRHLAKSVTRSKLVEAHHFFGVTPSKSGMLPDLKVVRRTRARRLSELHPDKNGGVTDPAKQ